MSLRKNEGIPYVEIHKDMHINHIGNSINSRDTGYHSSLLVWLELG
jgi:hypothetical protein